MAAAPTVDDLIKQSDALSLDGKLDEALAMAQQALALAQKGKNLELTGDALAAVCETSIAATMQTAETPCIAAYDQRIATLGKDHFKTYAAEAALANAYLDSDPERAIAMTREAAENMERLAKTPDEKWQSGAAWSMLALALKYKGVYLDAMAPFDRAVAIMSAPDAKPNIYLASTLTDYADMKITLGDYEGARVLAEQALALRERMQSPGHPDIADTLGVLGDSLRRMGRYDEAEADFRRALRIAEDSTPQVPQILGRAYQNLALVFVYTGRLDEAMTLQLKAVDVLTPLGDFADVLLGGVYNDLSNTYQYQGEYRKAEAAVAQALAINLKNHDRKFDRSLSYILVQANLKFKTGDMDAARALVEEVLVTRLATAPTSSRTADALMLRAAIQMSAQDYAGARRDLEQARQILAPYSPNSSVAIRVDSMLARTLLAQGISTDIDAAYDAAAAAAHGQAYVLSNMTRLQAATGGLQTPADRKEIFDTVLGAAWRKDRTAK